MKIAVLSSASAGGAGIAAYRIYKAIKAQQSHTIDFIDMASLDSPLTEVSPQVSATNNQVTNTHFTIDHANICRSWLIDMLIDYDYLNIHWSSYLLTIAEILTLARRGKKILFTMHDFYYITGGCHYPAGCTGYIRGCIGCPQVDEEVYKQESVIHALKLKREIFAHPNVHLSAPSNFIVDSAIKAGIIPRKRGHALRNAYKPLDVPATPTDPNVFSLLLIADSFLEERKGIELAINAIREFCKRDKTHNYEIKLHVVGTCEEDIPALLADSNLSLVLHGHVRDHGRLVDIFQQSQFMMTCSYEDNWPNILVEAGVYGCIPIVGKGHGCEEFCREFDIGFVASDYTTEAFTDCLLAAYETAHDHRNDESRNKFIARVKATHSYVNVANNYLAVYSEISAADGMKPALKNSLGMTGTDISGVSVSENYLGNVSRSLLAINEVQQLEFDSIKLTVEDTPFASGATVDSTQVIAIYDDQSCREIILESGNTDGIPVFNDGCNVRSIFMPGSSSFGLRQIRVQLDKHG